MRDAVLGIAFPEWANDKGIITEATALMNGYLVDANDTSGENFAGVFTHEFGHAINLSHAQVNGPMVYSSFKVPGFEHFPGVPGCVAPVHAWDHWDDVGVNRADPAIIETMYPFIDTFGASGASRAPSRTRMTWRPSRTCIPRPITGRAAADQRSVATEGWPD